jgi:hypothetical protein
MIGAMTNSIANDPASTLIGVRRSAIGQISRLDAVMAFATERQEKLFTPGGSAQSFEKAHFGEDETRKSKPFPLINFARAWPGLCWIWLNLGTIWIGLNERIDWVNVAGPPVTGSSPPPAPGSAP